MKTILFTGLTGKSGLVLAKHLADNHMREQYHIRAVVRPTSQTQEVQNLLPDMELCTGVLTDPVFLAQVTKNVDILFHIAGIHWSLPLVTAAVENGVKRVVLVHTTGIYSKYKEAGEEYRQIDAAIEDLAKKERIGLTILRPTMIYGTVGDQNVVKFIKMVDKLNPMPVVNHAKYLLQPVHAKDLGDAYMKVLKHLDETSGKNYILSGRDPVLLIDMFRIIADELGVKKRFFSVPFPIAYAGAWAIYLLSMKKLDMREKVQRLCESRAYPHDDAVKDFGYAPMSFEEGLRQEVRDYKEYC